MFAQQKIETEFIYKYDIGERREPRTLTMELHEGKFSPLLHFVGGPTGHETYQVTSEFIVSLMRQGAVSDEFCICAGTKNSWPKCSVSIRATLNFLSKALKNQRLRE